MSNESPTTGDARLDLASDNTKRLEVLMGEDYNGMEMHDYLSYISPEEAKLEIDTFEAKLKRGVQARGDLINNFKGHLGYLAA